MNKQELMQREDDKMCVENFTVAQILDSLPENTVFYKDSGLWQIRSDDMKELIYSQSLDQTFVCFIEQYAADILSNDYGKTQMEILLSNLAVVED